MQYFTFESQFHRKKTFNRANIFKKKTVKSHFKTKKQLFIVEKTNFLLRKSFPYTSTYTERHVFVPLMFCDLYSN